MRLEPALRAAAGAAAGPLVLGAAVAQRVRGGRAWAARPSLPPVLDLRDLPPRADPVALAAAIRALPQRHRPAGLVALAGLPDLPLAIATSVPELAAVGWRYPLPFRPCVLEGAGGVPLAGLVARHAEPERPAVIVTHGALTTKGFDFVRRASTRLFALGLHVAAVDLRGFGASALLSDVPSSLGWEEGADLLAIAARLRREGATSVGLVGFSLGGVAALAAARRARATGALAGGVLAVSAPVDIAAAIDRLSARPSVVARHFGAWLTLSVAANARVRALGHPERVSLLDAIDRFAAPYYGLDADALLARACALPGSPSWTCPRCSSTPPTTQSSPSRRRAPRPRPSRRRRACT